MPIRNIVKLTDFPCGHLSMSGCVDVTMLHNMCIARAFLCGQIQCHHKSTHVPSCIEPIDAKTGCLSDSMIALYIMYCHIIIL